MLQRVLGDGFSASSVSFGAMGLSEFYGETPSETASVAVLEKAAELGVSMIDTADMYGRGHNEELIGRFLKNHRSLAADGGIKIATKFGIERAADDPYKRRVNNSPGYIRKACENSLKRLALERIDLYYAHRIDSEADLAETMETLAGLVKEGKIAHIGLCEVSAATLKAANKFHQIAAVQSEYSLWTRDVEGSVIPACRELGIGFVAYSPLGRGFLSGRYTTTENLDSADFRSSNPRFQGDNLRHNLTLLPALEALADSLGASPAQVALAWLLSRNPSLVVIPGTKGLNRLEENCAAAEIEISPEQSLELERVFAPEAVKGERYTAEGMKGLDA